MKTERRECLQYETNRLSLLLMDSPCRHLEYMQGVYSLGENRYAVYDRNLSTEDIHHIIRSEMKQNQPEIFAELKDSVPNVASTLTTVIYFIKIINGQEEGIIYSLSDKEEYRTEYWDAWGVLDDGSILNPEHTEPLFQEYIDSKYNGLAIQTQ